MHYPDTESTGRKDNSLLLTLLRRKKNVFDVIRSSLSKSSQTQSPPTTVNVFNIYRKESVFFFFFFLFVFFFQISNACRRSNNAGTIILMQKKLRCQSFKHSLNVQMSYNNKIPTNRPILFLTCYIFMVPNNYNSHIKDKTCSCTLVSLCNRCNWMQCTQQDKKVDDRLTLDCR